MNTLNNLRRRIMLTCEDVNTFLVDYLEGELDERTRRRFEQHISDCGCCHSYLEQYEEIVALSHDAPPSDQPAVPDELAERTLAFLRTHTDRNHS